MRTRVSQTLGALSRPDTGSHTHATTRTDIHTSRRVSRHNTQRIRTTENAKSEFGIDPSGVETASQPRRCPAVAPPVNRFAFTRPRSTHTFSIHANRQMRNGDLRVYQRNSNGIDAILGCTPAARRASSVRGPRRVLRKGAGCHKVSFSCEAAPCASALHRATTSRVSG
jgi:hypothetical protein